MLRINNVEIYGLEESIIASGYPMLTEIYDDVSYDYEVNNLKYWLDNNLLYVVKTILHKKEIPDLSKYGVLQCCVCNSPKHVFKHSSTGKYYCTKHYSQLKKYGKIIKTSYELNNIKFYNDFVGIILHSKKYDKDFETFIDGEDLYKIIDIRWFESSRYVCSSRSQKLHRHILDVNDPKLVVDHIDGNPLNNRKNNLRICYQSDNTKNKKEFALKQINKVLGVYFKDNKWISNISNNKKQIRLGTFETEREAIIARLEAEKFYFKEFSPQRHLFKLYGIEDDLKIDENTDKIKLNIEKAFNHLKRIITLGNTDSNSGHGNALSGMIVQFDLKAPLYFWKQFQRYHFHQIISSTSTMHSIHKMDIKKSCNEYVTQETINFIEDLKKEYNENKSHENYMKLISNCPSGLEISAKISTNYLQLKNIYQQRKNHKLKEDWGAFCEFVLSLPYFKEITGIE